MAIYAIGDVQGCDHELGLLLDKISFSADRDQLWFVGDLVNRGPASVSVMRRVRALGDNAVVTLGNHDLHLIAIGLGATRPRKGDTLQEVIDAPDFDALLQWLIARPFMHEDPSRALALLHAGLPPQWDMHTARTCAQEAQDALRSDPERFVAKMYGDQPLLWDKHLCGTDRLRFITNCFTRLRYIDANGALELKEKDSPGKRESTTLMPWFDCEPAKWRGTHVVFGHWSTLGFFRNQDVTGLDTGCGWGDRLTALRVDVPDDSPTSVGCERHLRA